MEMSSESVSVSSPVSESTEVSSPAVESSESSELTNEGSESSEGSISSESAEEFSEELAEAIEEGASKEEINAMIREFELTVNGKKIKKSIDLSNTEELTKYLQKAEAFNEASQRAAKYEKDFEALKGEHNYVKSKFGDVLSEWQKTPSKVFEALGINKEEFIAQEVERYLEEQALDPKEKEIRAEKEKREALEKRLAEIEAREKAKRDEEESKRRQEEEANVMSALQNSIIEGISSNESLKAIESVGLISKDVLFDDAVAAMIRRQEAVGPEIEVTIDDVIPALEARYAKIIEHAKSLSAKPAPKAKPAPAKKVLPPTPNDVKPTASAVVEQVKAKEEAKRNEKKPSFSEVMRRR